MGLEDITQYVPVKYIVWTILTLIALAILGAKIVPVIIKWFNALRTKTERYEKLLEATVKNTRDIEIINQKIGRDYARLNELQKVVQRQQDYTVDSLEERELILRSLLGIIQGLQEVGANGPTKKAESEIQAYLLKKSHEAPDSSEV